MAILADTESDLPRCFEAAISDLYPRSPPFNAFDSIHTILSEQRTRGEKRKKEEKTHFWTVPLQVTQTVWMPTLCHLKKGKSTSIAKPFSPPRHRHPRAQVDQMCRCHSGSHWHTQAYKACTHTHTVPKRTPGRSERQQHTLYEHGWVTVMSLSTTTQLKATIIACMERMRLLCCQGGWRI